MENSHSGLRLEGRCRAGVVLLGRQFGAIEATFADANPAVIVSGAHGVELRSLTLRDGWIGALLTDMTGRMEDGLVHDITGPGIRTSSRRC